ncbi:hypothetical protein, partial [Chromatium okenii]|uniref:hypothetical protein n=1 Tax=Chromatium okenii TaxID=61644 RepID=UPI0026EB4B28
MTTITKTTITKDDVTYIDTLDQVSGLLVSSVWTDLDGNKGTVARTYDALNIIKEDGTWTKSRASSPDSSYSYNYDNSGKFTGGIKKQNGVTYTYDKDWVITKTELALPTLTKELDELAFKLFGSASYQTTTWTDSSTGNSGSNTSYFDQVTKKLIGSSNSNSNAWTDSITSQKMVSTNESYATIDKDNNLQWAGSSWKNFDSKGTLDTADDVLRDSGSYTYLRTQDTTKSEPANIDLNGDGVKGGTLEKSISVFKDIGSNSWTDSKNNSMNSDYTRYYTLDQTFLGGTETRDGVTTTWDKDWKVVSQKVITTSLPKITDASYTYDNKDAIFKLFANNDKTASIYYKQTNSWVDAQSGNSGKEISFFDQTGNKLGTEYFNNNSWIDQGTTHKILSSNLNYNTIDASGKWQWLGSSWKNVDTMNTDTTTDDVVRDSGTNLRVQILKTSEPVDIDLDGNGTKGDASISSISVLVEDGSNSWTDPQGNKIDTVYTRYFKLGENNAQTFLGGTETRDGVTTTWDKDWKV